MTILHVTLPAEPERHYPIVLGDLGSIGDHWDLSRYTRCVILTDENVATSWLDSLRGALPGSDAVVIPPGEPHKTLATVRDVWGELRERGVDRHSLLVNLGGGVVGDLGGFAASTYMRGLDFLQVPTTLLSQVDASVGGKVGVNEGGIKNLVGAFAQPIGVLVDPRTLTTLPPREYRAGLAEVLKHGLIRDRMYFESIPAELANDPRHAAVPDVIRRSCEIKAEVVQADERESGVRKILNLGHTVGHALESVSLDGAAPLLHGEAIAVGLVAEARISREIGLLSADACASIEERLAAVGLPTRWPAGTDVDRVVALTRTDKKKSGSTIQWTLLAAIGDARFDQEVDEDVVRRVLESLPEIPA